MRKPRQLQAGVTYHVTSKINRGNYEMKTSEIKNLFLEVIKAAKTKYDFIISNFCIMDNHFHFLITPGKGESLSKIMQWIKCSFTRRWNKKHNMTGHLWGERFWSRIINGIEDFLKTVGYIDNNPVASGLVKEAKDWEFGGLFHYIMGRIDIVFPPDEAILERYLAMRRGGVG
ncbi:MAG: transposase [Treponema sp.]|jgi:putative transposase|nr:transposase [Treponema sp.]